MAGISATQLKYAKDAKILVDKLLDNPQSRRILGIAILQPVAAGFYPRLGIDEPLPIIALQLAALLHDYMNATTQAAEELLKLHAEVKKEEEKEEFIIPAHGIFEKPETPQ